MLGHVGVNENLMKPSTFQQGCFKLSWEENDGWWQSQALRRLNGMRFSHLKKENSKFPFRCSREFRLFFFCCLAPHRIGCQSVGGSAHLVPLNKKKNATYNQSKLKGEQNQGFHSMAAVMVRSSWRFGRHAAAARAGECVGFLCFTNDDYQGPKAMHILNHQDPSHSQAARVFFLQANEGVKQHPFPRDDHHLDISCDQSIQTMGWGAPERDHVIDLLKLLCLLFLNRIIDQKLWRSHQNTPAWQQFDRLYPSLQCTKCIETLT